LLKPLGCSLRKLSEICPSTLAERVRLGTSQQVSNVGTEIAARILRLPNLIGSLRTNLAEIPDQPGPLSSALEIYDTGAFDLNNPDHAPFIPPLANLAPTANCCDPHGLRGYIPASIEQLQVFLQPGGQITNFCVACATRPSRSNFRTARQHLAIR